jgi:Reverse transcriptase (RNA-dependent DNA polymerase)
MRIDGNFKKNGYKQYPYEHAIFVKSRRGEILIVALYVDDLIFMENSSRIMEEFKGVMMNEFKMTGLELIKYILGLKMKQHKKDIFYLARSICEGYSEKIQDGELQFDDTDGARYKDFKI